MILQERTDAVYGELRRELLRFTPGSRFYSVRQLMLRYGVSRRVIDAAVDQLEREQAVEARPGSGIYVKQTSPRKRVAVFLPDWPSEGNRRFSQDLRAEFAKRSERWDFSIVPYDHQGDILRVVAETAAAVSILIWSGRPVSREELGELARLPGETVMMWSDLFGVSIHSVCANSEYGGMLAAAGFIRKGHRKLAVIASEPRNHDIVDRIAGFVNTARLFGAEAVEIPCEIHSGDYSTGCAHDAMVEYLAAHRCGFTGLFTMSDESTQGIISALAEYGLHVPDEVSIISYGNDRNADFFMPPLTTVNGCQTECARRLAAELDRREETHDSSTIYIRANPTLIERESVKNLKSPKK
ncbi:GntR family transcriptional regulator [Victivallis vadensis]|uniref:GntR family transcriptional regulator n=1 Tax=Victivallis vadensis TaxID=172901 RepID=UPI00266CC863|nr:GntR family transcriptional regulator [Victivallis vadensis]